MVDSYVLTLFQEELEELERENRLHSQQVFTSTYVHIRCNKMGV